MTNNMVDEAFGQLKALFEEQVDQQNILVESLADRVRQAEDIGWVQIEALFNTSDNTGIELTELKNLSKTLREMTDTHPMFRRGAQLRNSYVFGRGMTFADVTEPRVQRALSDSHNQQVVFSVEGYEMANKALFTSGIYTVLLNKSTRHMISLPLAQVSGVQTNPDDDMDIWFLQRSWGDNKVVWYPTDTAPSIPKSLTIGSQRVPVSQDTVAHIRHANRQAGWTFGLPDALAAMLWVKAYDAYLMDNAKLVKSLSQLAWKITQPNKSAVTSAAARVQTSGGGVGGTAAMSAGDLQSVGVPSAQVNFNNGQPLAAMIATSFGVPVIALLSSPGATGGSYGAATTLDSPTIKGFEALQDMWSVYYNSILRDLGSKNGSVAFASIESDATYRQITSLSQLVEGGLIWKDEARVAALDLMDIQKAHDSLPEDPKVTAAKIAQKYSNQTDTDGSSDTVVSKQGVSAKTGSNSNGDTDHDLDADR